MALIDKQLAAGPAYFHKQIITTCPLAFVATGLIAGILIQNASTLPIWAWLILLTVFATVTCLFFIRQKLEITPFIIAYTTLVCFVCLGAIRLANYYQPAPNDIRNLVAEEQMLATIRGLIVTEPYTSDRKWEFARFMYTDPTSSFYVSVKELETATGWAKASGTVRVQVDEPALDLKAGDYVQLYCWLDRFKHTTNPGQFDTAQYMRRNNVFIAASVQSRDGIEVLERKSGSIFWKVRNKISETFTQALLGDQPPQEQSQALLAALLLGRRSEIDSSTIEAFRQTGLLHFICLSGMNFGIFVGIIWWLCKAAGLMKPIRAAICIVTAIIFLLAVPPNAPALRAAIMCCTFFASFLFRRRSNPLNSLSLAAIILLLIKPTELFEIGWQLSFASVLGLLLFCERIHFFMYEKITGSSWFREMPRTNLFFRVTSIPGPYLLITFSTCLTAWLSSAGILVYHLYTFNYLTSIWTVAVSWLIGAISAIGYLQIVVALVLPSVGNILAMITNTLSDVLIWIVKLIAGWHISEVLIGKTNLVIIILYYCCIFFIAYVHIRRPLVKKIIVAAALSAVIVFLGASKWQRTHRDNLILTCLDVGHGQAILAQLPGRANILFDAGSLHKSNIGQRIIKPFLNYIGINKLDAIIISHNDIDHINGIPEIVDSCKVGGVYANDAFFSENDRWGTAKFLNESLLEKGLKIQPLEEHLSIDSNAGIKILWPNKQKSDDQTLGDNDKSAVALIEFAGNKILLCSDIEKFAQRELLRIFPNLKADIVVVPHHGSAKTADPDFLDALDADILLCSCGLSQYEKQQVIKNRDNSGVFYTPRDGAITTSINKNGTVKTYIFAGRN